MKKLSLVLVLMLGALGGAYAAFCPGPAFITGAGSAGLLACNLYVAATGGNDANNGSTAAPLATLGRLQTMLEGQPAGSKVGCLKAGTFTSVSLTFTLADAGEVWQADPASGILTAVLDGGGGRPFLLGASSYPNNLTFNGLKVQNCGSFCFGQTVSATAMDKLTFKNMELAGTNTNTGGMASSAAIALDNVTNCLISHNYVHGMNAGALEIMAFNAGETVNGCVIDGNVVIGGCTGLGDCGAIYTNMRGAANTGGSFTISNNFIRDVGAASLTLDSIDIYLDDQTSNGTIKGNIIGPACASCLNTGNRSNSAAMFNNSDNLANNGFNTWSGNIIDVGFSSFEGVAYIFGTNDSFHNNLVLFGFTGANNTCSGSSCGFAYVDGAPGPTTVQNNGYANCQGGSVFSNGTPTGDSSPTTITTANLHMSGYTYTLATSSAAFAAPVSLPPMPTSWGPPGFTVPTSTNHSC